MKNRILGALALSLILLPGVVVAAPSSGDLVTLSTATSPRVASHISRGGKNLRLTVEVESFQADGKGVSVQAGLSADKTVSLSSAKNAKVTTTGKIARFVFEVPNASLVASPEGWKKLRATLAVEWAGGPLGQPRLREHFLAVNSAAPHAEISANVADWAAIDLDELEREAKDRALQIHFEFDQPMNGKATIVIDNSDGKRIRNLLAAQPLSTGKHRIDWDGLDDSGNVVAPGTYQWRALSHPGLSPVHQLDFVNAPGSNHGTLHAAAFNGKSLYFAAPVAEGGHEMIELAPDGTFLRGFNPGHGHGLGRVFIAADSKYLYAAHDGMAWGDKVDRSKSDWKGTNTVSLMRLDLEKGVIAEFPDKVRYAPLKKYEVGPGSPTTRSDNDYALAGIALLNGKVYIADREAEKLLVVNPETAAVETTFPLPNPVAVASSFKELFAIADGKLQRIDPATGALTALATLSGTPTGLTVGPDGRFYVADKAANVVHVLDAKGKEVAVIGKPGGIAPGPYDPLKFQNPNGLVVADGLLWVTEKDRWEPKRLSAYFVNNGEVAKELFGPTNYGAQGAGFDPQDHTRWIGQGTLFNVDFTTGTAKPISILGGETGRRHTFWRQDGRTFIITSGKATYIQELLPDGKLKPHALLSSAHQFAYSRGWNPPEAFVEAFTKAYPDVKVRVSVRNGIKQMHPNHGYGMLWVDKSGDGIMQTEEIEFSTAATNLAGSGWSHDFHDLTIKVPADVNGKKVLVTLKPEGFHPGGAPKYPAINDAVAAAVPIDLPESPGSESAVDRFGNTVLNSSPEMRAFAPDGKLLWSYPNKWSGVHGSHRAPLPVIGQLQGALFFSGMVPLDDKADVMLLNGNHGQAFLLTSDGLYVDAIFPDVRMMTNPQAGGIGILGGECFGGTFGKSEKDGNYYFQGGGIAYRVYRIDGLKQTQRSAGTLQVTPEQASAAERSLARVAAEKAVASVATVATVVWQNLPPIIDGRDGEWKETPVAKWDKSGKFPVTVRATHDAQTLFLHFTVRDDSPWVNNGKDWQSLFKTGDGIDLQLGTDAKANPRRSGAAPGDLRLFIAPMGSDNVAVLYRHRVPGAKEADGVVFQSPWRSEKVDVVKRLENIEIAVQKESNLYRVEVAIPLAELGLDKAAGLKLRGDFGVIYGDGEGRVNVFRNYWSNQSTGLVNDVPGEIMLSPNLWGEVNMGDQSTAAPTKDPQK